MGPKDLATPIHFISSPWPMPRRKKCPRTNKESPNCQDILPRTILSSANRDHGRGKRHATKNSLLERPKGKPKRSGPIIGAWWRNNSRRGCHLHINTHSYHPSPIYMDMTPGQCYLHHNSSQNVRGSG